MTVVEDLNSARNALTVARDYVTIPAAAREFALAITAIEDAIMRTNRGFAKEYGKFSESDVQAGGR